MANSSVASQTEPNDEAWYQQVQQKAHLAIRIELRDFDWMSLDPETARAIHDLLPPQFGSL